MGCFESDFDPTKYQKHPEIDDVWVQKHFLRVRALDGINDYIKVGEQWHKTEINIETNMNKQKFIKQYCVKKCNRWIYTSNKSQKLFAQIFSI